MVCSRVLPVLAMSTLVVWLSVQGCGSSSSTITSLPTGAAGQDSASAQPSGSDQFPLSAPVEGVSAAGLLVFRVDPAGPLAARFSLQEATFVQLPQLGEGEIKTYVAEANSALTEVEAFTSLPLANVERVEVITLAIDTDTTSLIYQSDPGEVTFEDYVLVRATGDLPPNLRTAENIASRANELFPAGDLASFNLDPVPNQINTEFVAGGSVPPPDLDDALVVYAALFLPVDQRTPENLAETITALAPDAEVSAEDIVAIPGASLPGGVTVSPSVTQRPAGSFQVSVQIADLATSGFTIESAAFVQLATEIFPGFTSYAAEPSSSLLTVSFDQVGIEAVAAGDCVIIHEPGLDPVLPANQIARAAACPMPTVGNITFVAEVVFETNTMFEGTEIGGLSAITYDAARDQYLILSDDRGNPDPRTFSRFYTATIDIDQGPILGPDGIQFNGVTLLVDEDGDPFVPLSLDPEGLALSQDNTLFLSSEGDANGLIPPFVNEFTLGGQQFAELPLPDKYFPTADNSTGIRNNLAFESLTLTPNQRFLITGTENALNQDGPAASVGVGSPSRILKYDLITRQPVAEFIYESDPVAFPPIPAGSFSTNGLVELLALNADGTSLLALERSFSVGVGNTIKLYQANLSGATDVSSLNSIQDSDQPISVAQKELLLNFDDLGLSMGLDNVEGMTFGPQLSNGQQSLILVSDNNFSETQFTQFIILGLDL